MLSSGSLSTRPLPLCPPPNHVNPVPPPPLGMNHLGLPPLPPWLESFGPPPPSWHDSLGSLSTSTDGSVLPTHSCSGLVFISWGKREWTSMATNDTQSKGTHLPGGGEGGEEGGNKGQERLGRGQLGSRQTAHECMGGGEAQPCRAGQGRTGGIK